MRFRRRNNDTTDDKIILANGRPGSLRALVLQHDLQVIGVNDRLSRIEAELENWRKGAYSPDWDHKKGLGISMADYEASEAAKRRGSGGGERL